MDNLTHFFTSEVGSSASEASKAIEL